MKKSKTELTPEALEVRRAYFREYRRQNPEKYREYERRRWEKKAARIMAELNEGDNEE